MRLLFDRLYSDGIPILHTLITEAHWLAYSEMPQGSDRDGPGSGTLATAGTCPPAAHLCTANTGSADLAPPFRHPLHHAMTSTQVMLASKALDRHVKSNGFQNKGSLLLRLITANSTLLKACLPRGGE